MDDTMEGFIALALFAVLAAVVYLIQQNRLNDVNNNTVVHTKDILKECRLENGPVRAVLLRQSLNEYRDLGIFPDSEAAIQEVEKSFNRAKIDAVVIDKNTPDNLRVYRAFRSHGGKAEGRKLGGAEIRRV